MLKRPIVLPHHHQAIRLEVRQRSQHNAFYDAENGGVRTDAESERENRDRSEAGVLAEHAQRVAQVCEKRVEPEAAALLAAVFLHAFHRAKFKRRLPPRFLCWNSRGYVRRHLFLEVTAQLFAELPLPFAASRPASPKVHRWFHLRGYIPR